MSWSYSGDPSKSEIDAYRFAIQDTDTSCQIMQNEEIQYILDTYANKNERMYQLFSRMAILFARDIKKSLGPQMEDPTERIKFFKEQAEAYRKLRSTSGFSVPKYASPKIFYKDMQNNPPNIPTGRFD